MSQAALKRIHEKDVDFYKTWLCDQTPTILARGLHCILSGNNSRSFLEEEQRNHLTSKLIENMRFEGSLIATVDSGVVTVDGVVTLEANSYDHDLIYYHIRSR